MKHILYIKSSIFSDGGKSTSLANLFVEKFQATNGFKLIERDLEAEPVPHLDAVRFSAFTSPEENRTPEQKSIADYSSSLISEWRIADVVVIGLPMYNLGIPSTFKAYLDHIIRAGETFRYTADGPVGLLRNRTVYIFAARGGRYNGGPLDTQTQYMRHILALLGICDVEFIYAEGLNMGEDVAREAMGLAKRRIITLCSEAFTG